MSHRIILADFYWTSDEDPRVPLGHASILTALREQSGLDVRSIVVAVNEPHLDAAGISAAILDETQGIPAADADVAFGAYVWGEALLQDVLRRLREEHLRRSRLDVVGRFVPIPGDLERPRDVLDRVVAAITPDHEPPMAQLDMVEVVR